MTDKPTNQILLYTLYTLVKRIEIHKNNILLMDGYFELSCSVDTNKNNGDTFFLQKSMK